MADKYLGFKYRDKTIGLDPNSDFQGFIENSGEDLMFSNSPEFSNEFISPQFGSETYYLGNTKSNRTFNLKIFLDSISLQKYREFLDWLNLDSKGTLIFDYNKNYGFEVKIDKIENSVFNPIEACESNEELYYVSVEVSFITVNKSTAFWVNSAYFIPSGTSVLVDNDFGVNFLDGGVLDIYTLRNKHRVKNSIIIEFTGSLRIENSVGTAFVICNSGSNRATYYGEYGICIDANGMFLSCGDNPKFLMDAWTQTSLKIIADTLHIIYPTSREIL